MEQPTRMYDPERLRAKFRRLVLTSGVWESAGMNTHTLDNHRKNIRKGNYPTTSTMVRLLLRSGCGLDSLLRRERVTLTLRQAFALMLTDEQLLIRAGVNVQNIRNRRVNARKGQYPSDKFMRRWLQKTGWTLVVEETWRK